MGDKKPKKNSSGRADAHKAKQATDQANRPPTPPSSDKNKPKK